MKHPLSRPNKVSSVQRQLLVLAGVVLFLTSTAPNPVSALSAAQRDITEITLESPLVEKDKELARVESALRQKNAEIAENTEKITAVKEEAKVIVETKKTLAEEVAALKVEIEAKKARIEAIRLAKLPVPMTNYASDAAGNGYTAGNCTWYVKSRRPDIGNFWGNANAWLGSAQSAGFKTGNTPRVGAIAVTYAGPMGHVAYVESVSGGMVTISEMNYGGLYNMNTRTVPASDFSYIYEKA